MQTITRMYDDYADAADVVAQLQAANVPHDSISLIANADAHGRHHQTASGDHPLDPADRDDTDSSAGTKRGSTIGGVLGAAVGLLTGLGLLAIPGVGPVVAAGWLVTTIGGGALGAAGGGLIGALTGAGVNHDEAQVYAEGIKRGSSLVAVRTDEADVARVERIMEHHQTVNWQDRRTSFGPDWKGFNETDSAADSTTRYPDRTVPSAAAPPLTSEEQREREQRRTGGGSL